MSCRTTHGGTLATRLARAFSGLSDSSIQSLFHALKREGSDLSKPTPKEKETWVDRQRVLIKHAPLTARQRERSERDLFRAATEEIDAATFYALSRIEVRSRQEAVLREVKGQVADLEAPCSQADSYSYGEDGRPAFVWYASYGSNLSRERFLTYITGGTPEGSDTLHLGCRDGTVPEEDIPIRFSGRMHFAASSGRWGGGGVAFMDNDYAGHALGRAYLVSIDQFDDIVAQENGRTPGSIKTNTDEALINGSTDVTNGLYGNLVHIGDYGNAPVFTFTGDFSAHDALLASRKNAKYKFSATNEPSPNYIRMVGAGLAETFEMDVPQQADYIRGALGAEKFTRTAIMKILRTPADPVPPRKTVSWGTSSSSSAPKKDWTLGTGKSTSGGYTETYTSPRRNSSVWDDEEYEADLAYLARREAEQQSSSGGNGWGRDEDLSEPDYDRPWFDDERFFPKGTVSGSASVSDLRAHFRGPDDEPASEPVATPPVFYSKHCPMCNKPGHTMHDCPELASNKPKPAEPTAGAGPKMETSHKPRSGSSRRSSRQQPKEK